MNASIADFVQLITSVSCASCGMMTVQDRSITAIVVVSVEEVKVWGEISFIARYETCHHSGVGDDANGFVLEMLSMHSDATLG